MKTFKRYLSDDEARNFAIQFLGGFQAIPEVPTSIELRTGNRLTVYVRGHEAMTISCLPKKPRIKFFQGKAMPLPPLDRIQSYFSNSVHAIEGNSKLINRELDLQERLCSALRVDGRYVVVDQQIQIPRDALKDKLLMGKRIDLLLFEREGETLWLIEVKLAKSMDLDHSALDQLDIMEELLKAAGDSVFRKHYQEVLQQKAALGLVDGELDITESTPIKTALVVIGDPLEAKARIACWPAETVTASSHQVVLLACDAPLPSSKNFQAMSVARMEALTGPRAPYLPRKSRWNDVATDENLLQARWKNFHLGPVEQLGPLSEKLNREMQGHDVPSHTHVLHPRSSQAACLQLFAPALLDEEGARAALADCINATFDFDEKDRVKVIQDLTFEAPHTGPCNSNGCSWFRNMGDLAGEHRGRTTRLDVLIQAEGYDQKPVWIGVEFKYTEPEFGACGGFNSKCFSHADRHACLNDPSQRRQTCYFLASKKPRKYIQDWSDLFQEDPLGTKGPCALIGSLNQLYRSHWVLREFAAGDRSLFLVVYHERNKVLLTPERSIPGFEGMFTEGPIDRYRSLLHKDAVNSICKMAVGDLLKAYSEAPSQARWLPDLMQRYGDGPEPSR